MIDQGHFASDAIKVFIYIISLCFSSLRFQKRLEELALAWDDLLAVSADKRQKLQYAQKGEHFVREADEVLAWIADRVAIADSSEPGKDLEHVELLQKKFEEFLKVTQLIVSSC